MKKNLPKAIIITVICLTFLVITFFDLSRLDTTTEYYFNKEQVQEATTVLVTNGDSKETLNLPYTFKDLTPNTKISFTFSYEDEPQNYLYVQSLFTPFTIYVNSEKIFQYGRTDRSQSSLHDNLFLPTSKLILLPETSDEKSDVTIEYIVQDGVEDLHVDPFLMGDYNDLIRQIFSIHILPFAISIILIVIGIILFIASIFTLVFRKKMLIFLCMSLFLLFVGIWTLGESPISMIFFEEYWIVFFFSMFSFGLYPLPLGYFYLLSTESGDTLKLKILLQRLLLLFAILISIGSLSGMSPQMITKAVQICTYMITVLFFTFTNIYTKKTKNPTGFSTHIFIFFLILILFATVEFLNINQRYGSIFLNYFQIGTLIFSLAVSITGVFYTYENIQEANKKQKMEYDLSLSKYQLSEQKKGLQLMHDNAAEIKRQRHDLRHQLITIRSLIENDEIDLLKDHINAFIKDIPAPQGKYCENLAVNSILTYYVTTCASNNIEITTHLSIPETENQETTSDLCVIFGNMLENAVEACNRMSEGKKYIKINSRTHHDTLTIAMDNSFNGQYKEENGTTMSSKRNDIGIGLSSIKQIASKHSGAANFKADGNVFLSSIYLKIK